PLPWCCQRRRPPPRCRRRQSPWSRRRCLPLPPLPPRCQRRRPSPLRHRRGQSPWRRRHRCRRYLPRRRRPRQRQPASGPRPPWRPTPRPMTMLHQSYRLRRAGACAAAGNGACMTCCRVSVTQATPSMPCRLLRRWMRWWRCGACWASTSPTCLRAGRTARRRGRPSHAGAAKPAAVALVSAGGVGLGCGSPAGAADGQGATAGSREVKGDVGQSEGPVTGPSGRPQQVVMRDEVGRLLFPRTETRRFDEEAAALDGRRVRLEGEGLRVGVLRYRGAIMRPEYFVVAWEDGGREQATLACVREWLI
ncbi:hypothetical protein Agub_g15375, partial [Astrephomene gubernaculifera]